MSHKRKATHCGASSAMPVLFAVLLWAGAASAVEVSFDGTGYSADGTMATVLGVDGKAIKNQGGTPAWGDYGSNFAVVSNAGNGGDNNGLVSAATQTANSSAYYTPSLSGLGVPAFSTNTTQRFSLDLRLIDNGDLSAGTELYRLGIGLLTSPTFPVELQVMASGNINVRMGYTTGSSTKLTLAGALTEGGAFRTVSGTINYAAMSVDIFLDDAFQGAYAFSGDYTGYGQFKLNVRQTSTTVGIAIDNVSATATVHPVPPAATVVMVR